MLTPDLIAKFNQATGNNVPANGKPATPSRADEIRSIAKQATVAKQTTAPSEDGSPSFKASIGGAETIPGNVAKTFGNIPSDIANTVKGAVFNPLENIRESGTVATDIYKNRGFVQGTKDIAGGFADTLTKDFKAPGEYLVNQNEKLDIKNKLSPIQEQTLKQQDEILKKITDARKLGKDTTHLVQALKYNMETLDSINKQIGTKEDRNNQSINNLDDVVKYPIEHPVQTAIAAESLNPETQATISNKLKPVTSPIEEGASTVKNAVSDTASTIKEKIAPSDTIDTTTGKVLQGKTADIAPGKRGIGLLDNPEKIKTYKDLNTSSSSKISELAKQQDAILDLDTTPHKISEFTQKVGEGKNTVKINYVDQAVKNLNELYTKTADAEGLAKIKALESKAKDIGLTSKEVNNLARDYGSEFGSKAFGKTGEPLTSVNATKFENIRSGLKDTARGLLPDEASRTLDSQMSDLYKVKNLSAKMAEKVNTLTQRLQKPNILQKIGGFMGKATKITGVGDFASKLLGIDKVPGAATLNAVELEAQLSKNLAKINAALGKSDAGFIKDITTLANTGLDEANPISQLESQSKSTSPKSTTNSSKSQGLPNKQGGFIKIGGTTTKAIDAATKKELEAAIDYIRRGEATNKIMEDTISRLQNKYGIKTDASSTSIANKFQDLIEKTKTR